MSLYITLFISLLSFTLIYTSEYSNQTNEDILKELEQHSFIALRKKIPNPSITPHEINIISTDYKSKKRIIYDWSNTIDIWINYSDTKIAPKKFCHKVALLAEKYNIKMPILPL